MAFIDRAEVLLQTLKNAALDMEADLGKASRTNVDWPDLGGVVLLVDPVWRHSEGELDVARERLTRDFLVGHHRNAQQGRHLLEEMLRAQAEPSTEIEVVTDDDVKYRTVLADPLTTDEQAVVDQITALVDQIKSVTDHASAQALTATI
ncbi:hypothetical protein [Subtercola endophyticus]|uniref:hypothetical protein n=1 Tax=Subtercola endophyticus TaxID=2895559 RepID=UPI001E409C2F|nr:hypothetical protein [Subtercola endophyticus]UFS58932.1 hypothetical protein LQ955_18375 [Subtercola endophyticus]